ncbi:MAG: hypothetical protein R1F54_02710 [Candidatus Zeuxoniibacter abyssi]|nr:MAG: hypothetical protein R1F54_02710 [Candidatus Persebacteraceae bacterium AB1(2)]
MPAFDFNNTVRLIRETKAGQERNMYVHLRDLFAHLLGHSFENIVIDSPQESAGGNSPDLAIRSDTGLLDAKERIIYHDWIVVEAKVGKNIFRNPEHRERIFSDKQKYIRPETEWFVMIDPTCMVIRPIAARSQIDPNADKVFRWEEFTSADDFCNKLSDLHANSAANSPALTAFRLGDVSRIAVVKGGPSRRGAGKNCPPPIASGWRWREKIFGCCPLRHRDVARGV